MPTYPIYVVDAFTRKPFGGNPAAVCLVNDETLSDEDQIKMAFEMKHSETAFVQLLDKTDSYVECCEFNLRWFTPVTEVQLCGHATLASAAVLFKCLGNKSSYITFNTISGQLLARLESRGEGDDIISLDFPLNPPREIEPNGEVENIVRATIGNLPFSDLQYSSKMKKLLIRLEDSRKPSSLLESVSPDFKGLLQHDGDIVKGVIVTARSRSDDGDGVDDDHGDGGFDFYSRYFAPWVGIDEDPVTGSAHTVLGPYWSKVYGKDKLKAKQCSNRTGILWVNVREDERCDIQGHSSVVLQGNIKF